MQNRSRITFNWSQILIVSVAVCSTTVMFSQDATQLELVVQTGHTFPVAHAFASRDGGHFVTSSWGGQAFLWESTSGKKLREFDNAGVLAYSGNGKILATGRSDISLWDVVTGQKLRTIELDDVPAGGNSNMSRLELNRDGTILAVSESYHKRVSLWDTSTGTKLKLLGADKKIDNAPQIGLSGDGSTLIYDSNRETWDVWKVTSEKRSVSIPKPDFAKLAGISEDGKLALILDRMDACAILFETTSGKRYRTFSENQFQPTCGALSADGKVVAFGYGNGTISVWRCDTNRKLHDLPGFQGLAPNDEVTSLGFSEDGILLVAGNAYGLVTVWDALGGNRKHLVPRNSGCIPQELSVDGKRLSARSNSYIQASYATTDLPNDSLAMLWDLESGKRTATFQSYANAIGHWIDPDGREVLIKGGGEVALWDVNSGKKRHRFEQESIDGMPLVALSTDRKRLITGGIGITVWEPGSGKQQRTINGAAEFVSQLALSPDNRLLVTGSIDPRIDIFDSLSGEKLRTLRGSSSGLASLAFSGDGRRLATGFFDGTAIVWDPSNAHKLRTIETYFKMTFVALDREGRDLLTNGSIAAEDSPIADGKSILWDVETGEQKQTYRGHPAAISPDGRHVWTSHVDFARLWNSKSGKELCRLYTLESGKEWLVVTPEGYFDGSLEARKYLAYRESNSLSLKMAEATFEKYYHPGLLRQFWKPEL